MNRDTKNLRELYTVKFCSSTVTDKRQSLSMFCYEKKGQFKWNFLNKFIIHNFDDITKCHLTLRQEAVKLSTWRKYQELTSTPTVLLSNCLCKNIKRLFATHIHIVTVVTLKVVVYLDIYKEQSNINDDDAVWLFCRNTQH